MFESDYLMNMILGLFAAIAKSIEHSQDGRDPREAAETLDEAVGRATDMDPQALLSLSPESLAQVLSVSGTDPKLVGYLSRTMLLSARAYREGGDERMASLREEQARSLADGFGIALEEGDVDALVEEAASTQGAAAPTE